MYDIAFQVLMVVLFIYVTCFEPHQGSEEHHGREEEEDGHLLRDAQASGDDTI